MRAALASGVRPFGARRWPGALRRALLAALAAATLGDAPPAGAQEFEPRTYSNTPVGLNFVLASYTFTTGSVAFSPTLRIEDAALDIHSGALGYVRAIDVAGMSGKVAVVVPYAGLSGSASLGGQTRTREVSGFGDPRLRLSLNFLGAPALTLDEYRGYQQDPILGATVEIAPPLGLYDPEKLANIGTNRWSVKTELGASQALGR